MRPTSITGLPVPQALIDQVRRIDAVRDRETEEPGASGPADEPKRRGQREPNAEEARRRAAPVNAWRPATSSCDPPQARRITSTVSRSIQSRPGYVVGVFDQHADRRPILEQERSSLIARIDELTIGGEVDLEFDQEFADRGQVAGEREENNALAEVLRSELSQVERALSRMDEGSYGSCEVCGGDIGAERLEALPYTSRCIAHV